MLPVIHAVLLCESELHANAVAVTDPSVVCVCVCGS